jgi:hypothetical protein
MVGPDQPAKLGSHSSKEVLDCEGFFIAQPNPEFNGNMGSVPYSKLQDERLIQDQKKTY